MDETINQGELIFIQSIERQSNKKLHLTIPLVKTETLQSFKQKKAHFHPLTILAITPTPEGTWSGL